MVYNFRSLGSSHISIPDEENPNAGCPLYAIVREDEVTRDLNLCDYTKRESHLLTSDTNEIEVYFASHTPVVSMPKFIIHYRGRFILFYKFYSDYSENSFMSRSVQGWITM